mmetsp:Transcript_90710/g.235252  ORF Transcript_90710/g.235252 Transcript_90710/m.235252 type:complete len:97 (-) Transcript_90710:1771-2061(-)
MELRFAEPSDKNELQTCILPQSPPSLTILPMQKSTLSQGVPGRSSSAKRDGICNKYIAKNGIGSSPQRMASVPVAISAKLSLKQFLGFQNPAIKKS